MTCLSRIALIFGFIMLVPSISIAADIVINEFLALNDSTIADPQGEFDDYIELYNPAFQDVDLSGMYLTDDIGDSTKWSFPDSTSIPAEGYLLIWADNDDGDEPGLHTNFRLNGNGEVLAFFESDLQGNTLQDSITYGNQEPDISFGRYFDGGEEWGHMIPSPDEQNNPLGVKEPVVRFPEAPGSSSFPNPFNPHVTIRFTTDSQGPVKLAVYDLSGRNIRTLLDVHNLHAGVHAILWNGTVNNGRQASSGVYLYKISMDGIVLSGRMVLLR